MPKLRRVTSVDIVYEDAHMVVVNKPAGWRVARNNDVNSAGPPQLIVVLVRQIDAPLTPVHRVDDDVGGLVVLAKTKPALDFLSGEFQSKQARRGYRGFAVVATEAERDTFTTLPALRTPAGKLPEEFRVNYALAPDQHVPGRMHVYRKKGGRPAVTRFRIEEDFGRLVWFEAWPETSRRMQVRAHLSAVGAPVLGDAAHGLPEVELRLSLLKRGYKGKADEKPLLTGLALQAWSLTLRSPENREPVSWELPLPKDFEIALRNLRKFARR